ncbi:MAG: hypothetical protein ACYDAD_16115, partial [Acidimicrobiales bacterium]
MTKPTHRFGIAAVALLAGSGVGFLGACGGGPRGVTPAAERDLDVQVQALRQAAERGDRSAAEAQLQALRASVGRLRAAGQVSGSRSSAILAAADVVAVELGTLPSTTTSTTTTSTVSPTTTPPAANLGRGHDHKGGGEGGD